MCALHIIMIEEVSDEAPQAQRKLLQPTVIAAQVGHMSRQSDRQTDRQTDMQRDRETERQTGRQRDRQTDSRQTERQRDTETERQTDRQTDKQERQKDRQTERQTVRQRDRETDRHTDRQADRQTDRLFILDMHGATQELDNVTHSWQDGTRWNPSYKEHSNLENSGARRVHTCCLHRCGAHHCHSSTTAVWKQNCAVWQDNWCHARFFTKRCQCTVRSVTHDRHGPPHGNPRVQQQLPQFISVDIHELSDCEKRMLITLHAIRAH